MAGVEINCIHASCLHATSRSAQGELNPHFFRNFFFSLPLRTLLFQDGFNRLILLPILFALHFRLNPLMKTAQVIRNFNQEINFSKHFRRHFFGQ
jgi:hypothetical protein